MFELTYIVLNAVGGIYLFILALGAARRPGGRRAEPVDNYLVVVVTVGDGRVLPALRETVAQLERLGLRYVVVSSKPVGVRNVLVVPREEDGTKYRAIRWFVLNYARPDTWYIFLDDDSYPLDREFLRDIAYYGARGYVAGNGVIVPRPGRSRLAYALDWVRHFDDLTRYRFALEVLRRPIFGMHGELLIVRGDVLREIWPAMGDTVTEDFRFAMELLRRRYKTFQTRTRVSIKSPNSLLDFARQRARWASALGEAVRYRNPIPPASAAVAALLAAAGPLTALYGPTLATAVAALYAAVYIYGSLRARRYIVDVLLASTLELLAMAAGVIHRQRRFYVIDKT
ncbi:glycosyltransferase family 2 protein [Pyrobaculum neutrophilum]|uniref:Egghead-like protein n=1 Tax=Pyrobaculum neutrophilum (strain DSM 2338 / JCM 9278 / NBRC 100436 / V24Sta) TaxID=444157 RepID=B1YDP7_PYRNV|nr:glycosyltransferase family 2 protein [Pyrobaculum neutrophilum]ACB39910.1 egghead-like protein [Pyrobaculum neutrophilum V24Sta]